ncbi:MAG: hypothetical protein MUF54_07055 [Polyangiaceae bacterium]|jgi:hypothetical protein|nr:hypothetical protein [Polyangiaceae bacterium]
MPARELPPRDQERTAFSSILQNLLDAVPGAVGAALVDSLGEAVDYAGVLDRFDICVAAAHLQLQMRTVDEALSVTHGRVRGMVVGASRRSYAARELVDGYVVVIVFAAGCAFSVSSRAFAHAEYEIRAEGGWEPAAGVERWATANVVARPHNRWRPSRVRVGETWFDVEVIGALVGLDDGERGYRVRTDAGVEMTLVRERTGVWYADIRIG